LNEIWREGRRRKCTINRGGKRDVSKKFKEAVGGGRTTLHPSERVGERGDGATETILEEKSHLPLKKSPRRQLSMGC